ncbi:MAG: hypothetical protein HQL69_21895 [Magnetococcales bacterium]|nr:hypothetical protein [Magnetococcales bacterium]
MCPSTYSSSPANNQAPGIAFSEVLERAGLRLNGSAITSGKIIRVDVLDDKKGSKNGWYIFYDDGIASGAYGSWKTGENQKWCSKSSHEMTQAERDQYRQQMEEAKRKRDSAKKHAQAAAAKKATDIIKNSVPADPNHQYLQAKKVNPCGILQSGNDLIIPIRDIKGCIQSLQRITPKGNKWFLTDGKIDGGMFVIGEIGNRVFLAEGFSTGATNHKATDESVIVGFNAGNLLSVSRAIRAKHQDTKIIITADDDNWTDGNPGIAKANEVAAKVSECTVIIPQFQDITTRPTDFNDLENLEGIEIVREQLQGSEDPLISAVETVEKAIEATPTDPGAPFEKEVLEALSIIKADDRAEYQRLRIRIKKASKDVQITEVDKLVSSFTDGNQEQIPHLVTARLVIKQVGPENIIFVADTFNRWGTGVWRSIADREIKMEIHAKTEGQEPTKSTVESILDLIKTECFKPGHQFNVDTRTINVLNGELHFQDGGWKLFQHYRENYRTTQLPTHYDATATAPRFCQFLDEIFHEDEDAAQKILAVIELLGYSILTTAHLEKFVLLIGAGANGKSVLLAVVEALVGRESISAVQPSQFDNKFQRAHLHGKLVNIVTEIAEGAEIHDAQLKAIVSGELTTAEHKHKSPFDFTPFSTCWFGTNHMPHTRDFSEALFRRAIILTFNQKFYGTKRDVHLKSKLITELPGILNLALDGAKRILTHGGFTTVGSSEEAKKKWRVEADQVAQFAEECCTMEAGGIATSQEIWRAYQCWTSDAGIKRSLNRGNFTNRLERLGVERSRDRKVRMWSGISLNYQES